MRCISAITASSAEAASDAVGAHNSAWMAVPMIASSRRTHPGASVTGEGDRRKAVLKPENRLMARSGAGGDGPVF